MAIHARAKFGARPLQRALAELIDLAWPVSCAGCDAWGARWCDECAASVDAEPRRVRPGLAPHLVVQACASFDGPLRRAITVFKDEGRSDIAPVLAPLLARSVVAAVMEFERSHTTTCGWTLVPVPSTRAATRARGRFPLAELTGRIERASRDAPSSPLGTSMLLRSARRTADQSRLGRESRRANVEGAFVVDPRAMRRCAQGDGIVLVDDVVTTGATLASAYAALRAADIAPIVVATVAATPRSGRVDWLSS